MNIWNQEYTPLFLLVISYCFVLAMIDILIHFLTRFLQRFMTFTGLWRPHFNGSSFGTPFLREPDEPTHLDWFQYFHRASHWWCGISSRLSGTMAGYVFPWWLHQMETFSALPTLCTGNSPVNSTHKGQWRGTLMFSLICWINGWVSNHKAGDLRRHRDHQSQWSNSERYW